jgi:hypothetical protein
VGEQKGTVQRIDGADRKRLLVATAATMLALPLLVRENRAQQGDRPNAVAAVAPGIDLAGPLRGGSNGTANTLDVAVTQVTSAPVVVTTAAPIEIATPVSTSGNTTSGLASYKRLSPTPGPRVCAMATAPRGRTLHVLDIDNGHEVTCTNVSTKQVVNGNTVLLDTATFKELADLAQAPIPITVSW